MITFCGYSYRSSGHVRGMQLASHLEGSDFLDVDRLNERDTKNNVIVYVRKFDHHHAQLSKKRGHIVGYDVLDNPVTDFIRGRTKEDNFASYVSDSIDFYIVNNDVMLLEMKKHTDKPVYVIPHHNCNFGRKHKKNRKPQTIGYIGLPEQSIAEDGLKKICEKFNLQFINRDVTEHSKLDAAFSEIDIGLVYFDLIEEKKELQEKILKYKPGTKLSNFQSYGIPTICLPYESFKQFGYDKYLSATSLEEVEFYIEKLMSRQFYEELSVESVQAGEKLHIENVVDYYRAIVKDFKR